MTCRRRVAVDFEALAAELRRGPTNLACFDAGVEFEGVGRDGVRCQVAPAAEPGSARPSLRFSDLFEADCS